MTTNERQDGPSPSPPARPERRGRAGRLLRNLLLALVSLLFAAGLLVVLELALRSVDDPSTEAVAYRFHVALNQARWEFLRVHRHELLTECAPHDPNEDEIAPAEEHAPPFDRVMVPTRETMNASGFRDRDFPTTKAPGTKRILFLGDSTGYGKGIEEARRFASILRAAAPPHVEVYNLALQGCTSAQIARIFEEHGDLEPDLVIVQAPGNDYDQTLWRLAGQDEPSALDRLVLGALDGSHLVRAVSRALFGDPHDEQLQQAIDTSGTYYRDDLDGFFALAAERGAKVAVVSLIRADGHRYGVHVARRCEAHPDICLGVLTVDFDDLERWIPDALPPAPGEDDPLGYPWLAESAAALDVPPATLAEVLPYHHLFYDIIHPNTRGNLLIGRQLVAFVKEHWDGWTAD